MRTATIYLCALTTLTALSGCYTHTTVPAQRVSELRAMCGTSPKEQPDTFKVTEETQLKVNYDWVPLCGTTGHSGDEVRLRTPDSTATVGAIIVGGVAAVMASFVVLFFLGFGH